MTEVEIQQEGALGRRMKIAGLTVLAAAAAGAVLAVIMRDQMTRHRRDLFSPNVLQRLAALGYLGRGSASVDNITLLKDFIAWEPRRLLRRRARGILSRMEEEARARAATVEEKAG